MAVISFASLKDEYQRLFDSCKITKNKMEQIDNILATIDTNRARYDEVGKKLAIPWYVVAIIHNMESSLNFNTHLHNGDPLTKKTIREPKDRPSSGNPPFTWEESAIDALTFDKFDQWKDWSLPNILFKLEGYNGWGYRLYHSDVFSPYLWSASNHYTKGKYVDDGTWSNTAVSQQYGAAVLLRRMTDRGTITWENPDTTEVGEKGVDIQPGEKQPLVYYSPESKVDNGKELQQFLNQFSGIYLSVDGCLGDKTSEAFQKVTGYYLFGDPRNQN